MLEEVFFEVVDDVERVKSRETGNQFMHDLIAKYDLSNVAYLGLNIKPEREAEPYIVATYDDTWVKHYESEDYVSIDPVVRRGLLGLMPLDWQFVRDEPNKKVRRLFGEAKDAGVGHQGLSFPIRGRHGEVAVFSINSHANDDEWAELKRRCMRDFQILSFHFHTRVLEQHGVSEIEYKKLAPRETECLKWSAAGKSAAETASIIGVSGSAVKCYLENARTKLDSVTTTQAVAKAVRLSLI